MEKQIYLNLLYDYYKDLFTDKQKEYFESYYCNNYSLAEIAENYQISRNAVHNQLKIVETRLIELEKILGMMKKKEEIIKLLKDKIDKSMLEKIEEIL